MNQQKVLVITAPSGAGKTTIVRHLVNSFPQLAFSISATTRVKRAEEIDGKDYYFFSNDKFDELIEADAFLEWEEVYANVKYGSLKREIDKIWESGKIAVFDVDVKGAVNIKKYFKHSALSIFIKTPSLDELLNRLKNRKTETPASLKKRIDKAADELTWEQKFDKILINDNLEEALLEAENLLREFLDKK